jgi:co-chaperonin GroES (HSP10)
VRGRTYMNSIMKPLRIVIVLFSFFAIGSGSSLAFAQAQQAPGAQSGVVRQVGAIKSISGNSILLVPDSGAEIAVSVQEGARMLRMAPGQQDLKSATPIQISDVQVGDRVLVRGKMSDDNKTLLAASLIVMKQSDIAAKHQQELQDWQRRGMGGLVKSVDPATGTVTISTMTAAGAKNIDIKSSKSTVFRRYVPDSVRFDDAKLSTVSEIKPGDQVRARGEKNADGTEVAAEEIVSGSFRNIAGTVSSVDAAANTITVMDLETKKPAVVHIAKDSQMHKLPQMLAMGLAMRLKGGAPGAQMGGQGQPGAAAPEGRPPNGAAPAAATGTPGGPEGRPRGGDLSQMLNRLPPMQMSELQKGDAVMIVSTPGSSTSNMTVITLLSGVEPILTASPNGSGAASLLSSWTLASAPDAGGGPQ